jgi:hypothetical protein
VSAAKLAFVAGSIFSLLVACREIMDIEELHDRTGIPQGDSSLSGSSSGSPNDGGASSGSSGDGGGARPGSAGINEDCTSRPCIEGASCIRAAGGSSDSICLLDCSSVGQCPDNGVAWGGCGKFATSQDGGSCLQRCDPRDVTACGPDGKCAVMGSDDTHCAHRGDGVGAGGCLTTSQSDTCAAGYLCSNNNTCRKWCMIGGTDCGSGTCSMISGRPTFGGYEFGVCL